MTTATVREIRHRKSLLEVADSLPWGTYEACRERLYWQWRNVDFQAETGISVDALRVLVRDFFRENADLPRVLLRAHAFRIVTDKAQLAHDPIDWFASKINHGGILNEVREEWQKEAESNELSVESSWARRAKKHGIALSGIDLGHISPGWDNMFQAGLAGLIAQSRQARESAGDTATNDQLAFWRAVEIVYTAVISLAHRFADLADRLAREPAGDTALLSYVAETFRRIPERAPTTFHQALQFAWLMHELIEMEGVMVRSMGHFDRTMLPYYQADLDGGRLNRNQAKELIKFFWMKWFSRTQGESNGKNFTLAGQDAAGRVITNDLTYAALEAYEEMGATDPKFSVRILPTTPDKLFERVADLIRGGHPGFVLMNDPIAIQALVNRGKRIEDARRYVAIGCYEPAVDGKEAACTTNIIVNLAKAVELALFDGTDPLSGTVQGPRTGNPLTFERFEDLFGAYTIQLKAIIDRAIASTVAHETLWPRINPSPLIAGTISDCLARGMDIGEGGAHYNSVGCVGMALANACDSLAAVKRIVYDEGRYSMNEVLGALADDFRDSESMRLCLQNRGPKWGNGDRETDALARRIADLYCDTVHSYTNARGGRCQAALYGLATWSQFGRQTDALPDGRKGRQHLASGVGNSAGADRGGVTGVINSVVRLDYTKTPNGSVLDLTLHPSSVASDDGLAAFVALIRSFFSQGGYAVQFNIFSRETLIDAQQHPEKYTTLQIRVTGWSAYWNSLARDEQELYITRNAHSI